MAMGKTASVPLMSKFTGCLVGAVIGDCLGGPFEASSVSVKQLHIFFSNINDKFSDKNTHVEKLTYSDDTAMARQIADSLIHKKQLDIKDMAKRFYEGYFQQPYRGYGSGVVTVFHKLKNLYQSDAEIDVFQPAKQQFGGSGSYGNGGSMRIAPMALYALKTSDEELEDLVTRATQITHSHEDAILGAILECHAISLALKEDNSQKLDRHKFLKNLIEKMKKLEKVKAADESPPAKRRNSENGDNALPTYTRKLELMQSFLEQSEDVPREEVVDKLGNNISALGSVPAAVYSFLRCTDKVEDIEFDNAFKRTIAYAISLGGDTDTIATMAGAIAGAYYGIDSIPKTWKLCCEGVDYATDQANKLYDMSDSETK